MVTTATANLWVTRLCDSRFLFCVYVQVNAAITVIPATLFAVIQTKWKHHWPLFCPIKNLCQEKLGATHGEDPTTNVKKPNGKKVKDTE